MILLGLLCTAAALLPLYLKYRVVLTGQRCKGKITGIAEQRGGYSVGGYAVKKRAYLVKISGRQYYTAHGCLFASSGRKKIGKEIWVFRNETYGQKRSGCSGTKPTDGKSLRAGIFGLKHSPCFSLWPPGFAFIWRLSNDIL